MRPSVPYATKRSTAQKADFVPGHKIGQLLKFALLEGLAEEFAKVWDKNLRLLLGTEFTLAH
jgi:hypothetical protein